MRFGKNSRSIATENQPEGGGSFPASLRRWIESERSFRHQLGVQAFGVGVLTGSLWVLFSRSIALCLHARDSIVSRGGDFPLRIALAAIVSGLMVTLAMFLARRFAPETLSGGIAFMEGMLDGVFRLRPGRVLPVKWLGSTLILGSGMTLGPEGPIIQMGGALGTAISRFFFLSDDREKVLVASGVGAAMAGAFNAPLGGILLVMEEFRPEFENRIDAWHAVALSVVGSTLATRLLLGNHPILSVTRFSSPPIASLWIFALLGILFGFLGYGFNRLFFWFGDRLGSVSWSAVAIGALIGALTVGIPAITGDGLDTVIRAFDNRQPGWAILLIFAARFLLTILCGATGASGGLYAPMLGLATLFSLGFARQMHAWFPGFLPRPAILAIAGMVALVAATTRTPLAAIVITVEITDNYELLLAMIVCSLCGVMTAHRLGGEPLYGVLLRRSIDRAEPEGSEEAVGGRQE